LVNDNHLETLEGEKERVLSEYLKASANFDEAKLYAEGQENPLSVVEPPVMPLEPEPSHRKLFSAFAGVAGGTLTSVLLFLLAFVDTSIRTPGQFQPATGLPLLGSVNRVKMKWVDLQSLFTQAQTKEELEAFKENIRKLRSSFENSGTKSFLFVSPKEGEGRSFLIASLAYALGLNNKRVLIVDTNFKHNTLSELKGKKSWVVSTAGKEAYGPDSGDSDFNLKNINIVANKGGSQSPSEVLAGKNFAGVMEKYASNYDFVFLEAASMNKYSDARELLPYVEKIVAVFSSESSMGSTDKDTLEYLQGLGDKMFGGVLNEVDLKNV
jgi:Mrp family chromosome partitioning ATPase